MLENKLRERFRELLFRGRYNLLLGAGISRDAKNSAGKDLQGSEELRQELCALKGLRPNSSLARATAYLSPGEISTLITNPFSGCKAGKTASAVTRFVWSQIFTFNIDDVLEDAYGAGSERKQGALTVNYTKPFESFRHMTEVPIVHLHGFVGEPSVSYVFSTREYAQVQRQLNPWMHLLSDLLRTEPFIIAGTSITEPDLEYYLTERSVGAFRPESEISLLIEPSPDAGTEEDCVRFGLHLVKATLAEFLEWVEAEFGPSPTVSGIVAPTKPIQFRAEPDQYTEVAFLSDFELVAPNLGTGATTTIRDSKIPSFYFGRAPSWADLVQKRDVILKNQVTMLDPARQWLRDPSGPKILAGIAPAGSGKTTTLRRVALELSADYTPIFFLKAQDGLDVESTAAFLQSLIGPAVLCIDNFAERAGNVQDLLDVLGDDFPLLVLGTERQYRREHVETVIDGRYLETVRLGAWTTEEFLRLVENYRALGLLGQSDALKRPNEYVPELKRTFVAEAVCMLLNDFRPLRNIVTSLWNDAGPLVRESYLCVALAHYCQPQGVRARIVASAIRGLTLSALERADCPLPVTESPDDDEFIIPLNATVGTQLIEIVAKERPDQIYKTFVQLANALSPYVTRQTIMRQTAEARLAGRLFDADKIVRPLLGALAEQFFEAVKDAWQWNSRYWEQRALTLVTSDLRTAVQHARQAVAIEKHPFPMTTLANLLLIEMVEHPGLARTSQFDEAYELLRSAIDWESKSGRRRTKHAFWVLLRGVKQYLESGGTLSRKQFEFVKSTCADVERLFVQSEDLVTAARGVKEALAR